LGELDENDPETRGEMLLEGQLLASIVQDFEQHVTKERTTTLEKERLDSSPILGKEEEDNEEEEEEEEEEYQYEDLFERNNVYLHEKKEKEQWDCETIISTYSTLDNHPTRIKEPSLYNNKKKKKKKENQQQSLSLPLVPETKILLSKKTGMPLDVAMSRTNRTTKMTTINDFIGKKTKNETKEEKKIRKKVMKLLKKDRRVEKKQTKQAFKEEEQRQFKQQRGGGGGGGGAATTAATPVSIFKYS
jgi:protein LTV1